MIFRPEHPAVQDSTAINRLKRSSKYSDICVVHHESDGSRYRSE